MSEAPLADFHSHLVPGVDDGSRTLEEAVEGVGRLVTAGVGSIVTTPHLEASLTRDPEELEARLGRVDHAWRTVADTVAALHPDVVFRRGHELRMDIPDPDLSDDRLRLAGTSFVLVEWARFRVPEGSAEVIARLRSEGLRPIVAHPERYRGVDEDVGVAARWRGEGAYLQVNHGSLTGRYGSRARSAALELLRRGWVDYLSSDFHGRTEEALHVEATRDALDGDGGERFLLLAGTNPGRVLAGEDPVEVPPLRTDGLLGKLVGLLKQGQGR